MKAKKVLELEIKIDWAERMISLEKESTKTLETDVATLMRCRTMSLCDLKKYFDTQPPEITEVYADYTFEEFRGAIESDTGHDKEILDARREQIRLLKVARDKYVNELYRISRRSVRHRNTFVLFWPVVDALHLVDCLRNRLKKQMMKLGMIEKPKSTGPSYHLMTFSNN